jgi:hypothetical protein
MMPQKHVMVVIMFSAAWALGGPPPGAPEPAKAAPHQAAPAEYAFTVSTNMLAVTNGVRLAVTYYQPTPNVAGEKFPAIFEMHPYRKDDFHHTRFRWPHMPVRGPHAPDGSYWAYTFMIPTAHYAVEAAARGTTL